MVCVWYCHCSCNTPYVTVPLCVCVCLSVPVCAYACVRTCMCMYSLRKHLTCALVVCMCCVTRPPSERTLTSHRSLHRFHVCWYCRVRACIAHNALYFVLKQPGRNKEINQSLRRRQTNNQRTKQWTDRKEQHYQKTQNHIRIRTH